MGGGRNNFMKKGENSTGKRHDEDLIQNWKNDKKTRFSDQIAKYITTRQELLETDMSKTDFVLGKEKLFNMVIYWLQQFLSHYSVSKINW